MAQNLPQSFIKVAYWPSRLGKCRYAKKKEKEKKNRNFIGFYVAHDGQVFKRMRRSILCTVLVDSEIKI